MRIAFGNKLELTKDVRQVPDPWGLGWIWSIRRLGSRQYKEFLQRKTASHPVQARLMNVLVKVQGSALVKAAVGRGEVTPSAAQKTQDQIEKYAQDLWEQEADKLELSGKDLADLLVSGNDDEHLHVLVAGWPAGAPVDEAGQPVPFCREALAEILANDEFTIPHGLPHAGRCLGDAVRAWVMAAAAESESARQSVLVAAAGNSEPSSAGVPDATASGETPTVDAAAELASSAPA